MAWTDELKQKAIDMYLAGNPTAENSVELIKEIAEDLEQSPNGVRMILVKAEVYVKKAETAGATKTTTATKEGDAPKRVSKEASISALVEALTSAGAPVDNEILSKLTGKAAVYLTSVVAALVKEDDE